MPNRYEARTTTGALSGHYKLTNVPDVVDVTDSLETGADWGEIVDVVPENV